MCRFISFVPVQFLLQATSDAAPASQLFQRLFAQRSLPSLRRPRQPLRQAIGLLLRQRTAIADGTGGRGPGQSRSTASLRHLGLGYLVTDVLALPRLKN